MEPAARSDTVGHIGELVGAINLDKVLEDGGLDEVRVQLSDTIDLVRSDNGEERHPNHLGLGLLNDGHTAKNVAVVGEGLLNLLKEEEVDVVDNLQVPWQKVLEQTDGPLLESLWKNSVVGVAELENC